VIWVSIIAQFLVQGNTGRRRILRYTIAMPIRDTRPKFLDIARIHMPVTAVLSIGHRLSGIFLVLVLPVVVYFLELSLAGPRGFAEVAAILDGTAVRTLLVFVLWLFVHHLFAGIRFLITDLDVGVGPVSGRRGAWVVIVASIAVVFVGAWVLL